MRRMSELETLREVKSIISEFQEQVKSNSVLDFSTWVDNRFNRIYILKKNVQRDNQQQRVRDDEI